VAEPTPAAIERLKRGVIEASKQCGRNRLMAISEPIAAGLLFADTAAPALRVIADPSGNPLVCNTSAAAGSALIAAIGPEGGFVPSELAAAQQAGWLCVSLGPRILRVETAAIALAAAISDRSAGTP
jgi:16S rRNA (uracil1498-N3)-methyltransferase